MMEFNFYEELKAMDLSEKELSKSSDDSVFHTEKVFQELLENNLDQMQLLSAQEQNAIHRIMDKVFEEATVRRARVDSNVLIEYVIQDDVTGEHLKQEEMHRELQNAMGAHDLVLCLAPRGHGKSTQVVGRILFELGKNPNVRIKLISNVDKKAADRVQMVQKYINESSRLRRVFPNLKPAKKGQWNNNRMFVARSRIMNDPSLEAFGVLSSGTGGRVDILILDDVVDLKNAILEPGLREKVKDAVRSDWLAQLAIGGWCVAIATLWHKKDLHHELGGHALKEFLKGKVPDQSKLREGDWMVKFFAVGPNFEAVCPRTWPTSELKKKYRMVGRKAFNRGWRQIASDDTDKIVKPEWIKYFEPSELPDKSELVKIQSYDVAISTKGNSGDSYFARVSVGVAIKTSPVKIYVLEYFRDRIAFPQQVEVIRNAHRMGKPDLILIEAIAYQQALPQYLKAETLLPIVPVTSKPSKAVSLEAASVPIEAGHVLFHPRFNVELNPSIVESGDLVEEITEFPIHEIDDGVDAFSQVVNFIQDNIFGLLGLKDVVDLESESSAYMLGFEDEEISL